MPVLACQIELRTEFGRRVYHRVWDRLKADLYVITVRSRTVGMDEAARTMEAMITEEFESVRRDLESEIAAADALRETVKTIAAPAYPNVAKQEAQYSTPRAYEFLMLILQMDALLQVHDFLWLSGIIDTHARVMRAQNWQRRLTKVANRMRELGNRTRAAATREIERRMQRGVRGAPAGSPEGDPPALIEGARERTAGDGLALLEAHLSQDADVAGAPVADAGVADVELPESDADALDPELNAETDRAAVAAPDEQHL